MKPVDVKNNTYIDFKKGVKNTVPWTYVINIVMAKKLLERATKD